KYTLVLFLEVHSHQKNLLDQSIYSHSSELKSMQNRSLFRHFLSATVGGIISAHTVILLFINGVIPLDQDQTNSPNKNEEQAKQEVVQTVASDDEEEIYSNIEEVSKAVVGVINLQEQNSVNSAKET